MKRRETRMHRVFFFLGLIAAAFLASVPVQAPPRGLETGHPLGLSADWLDPRPILA